MLKPLLMMLCLLPSLTAASQAVTALAVAGKWQASATALARVSARQQAVLRLPFAARIISLNDEPGARVAAGDDLASFDAPLLRRHLAAWKQALLEVRLSQKRLQVLRESESQRAITRRERVAGEQAVAQALGKSRMTWETLAADLDFLHVTVTEKVLETRLRKAGIATVARGIGRLKAPFTGLVTKRRVALGEQVNAGSPVFELETLQQVYLDVGVPEAALPFWRAGETRWYSGAAEGRLQPLDGAALYDAGTGLWLLRFKADNPGLVLRDGAWIEVSHTGAPKTVAWVPAAAVVARNRKTWCIRQQVGRFKAVEVQAGPAVDGRTPILAGIAVGDRVVTEGAYELLYRDLKTLIKFVD